MFEPLFDRLETVSEYLGVDTPNFYWLKFSALYVVFQISSFSGYQTPRFSLNIMLNFSDLKKLIFVIELPQAVLPAKWRVVFFSARKRLGFNYNG